MQAGECEAESRTCGRSSGLSTVQCLTWWGGIGQQPMQAATSSPLKSFAEDISGVTAAEDITGVTAAVSSLGFVHPQSLQQASAPVLVQTAAEATRMQSLPASGYEGRFDEQRQRSVSPSVVFQPTSEYFLPPTQLELGHAMARAGYPYADPYFGSIVAAYGAQAMIHPHMLGVQQARMPLPSEITEEEPVYVNAKQYHGILRRRQSRAKAESENKLIRSRKPYLHESRHLHAMRRARGCGGRFLNTKSKDDSKSTTNGNVSSEGQQSSQEGTSPDSHTSHMEPKSHDHGIQTVQGISSHLMVSTGQSVVSGAGYHPGMLVHSGHPIMSSSMVAQGVYHNINSNQGFHSSVFHSLPGGDEGDCGQGMVSAT